MEVALFFCWRFRLVLRLSSWSCQEDPTAKAITMLLHNSMFRNREGTSQWTFLSWTFFFTGTLRAWCFRSLSCVWGFPFWGFLWTFQSHRWTQWMRCRSLTVSRLTPPWTGFCSNPSYRCHRSRNIIQTIPLHNISSKNLFHLHFPSRGSCWAIIPLEIFPVCNCSLARFI